MKMGKQNIITPSFPIFTFTNVKRFFLFNIILITAIIVLQITTTVGTAQVHKDVVDDVEFENNNRLFNIVLQSFSNENGKVDYTSIRNDPYNLNKFISFINDVSPISHPKLFSEVDAKAYWINVYNALAIKTIIDNPDVISIREVSWGMGAFWRNKFVVGGKKMTLNHIEHKILRKKYQDPRIHFAINCASNSCPPIGNRIVTGDNLDAQLDKKAYAFMNDTSNIRFDHIKKEIHISRIFKWFKKDFMQDQHGILSYILEYHSINDTNVNDLNSYKFIYNKYDWLLNE